MTPQCLRGYDRYHRVMRRLAAQDGVPGLSSIFIESECHTAAFTSLDLIGRPSCRTIFGARELVAMNSVVFKRQRSLREGQQGNPTLAPLLIDRHSVQATCVRRLPIARNSNLPREGAYQ